MQHLNNLRPTVQDIPTPSGQEGVGQMTQQLLKVVVGRIYRVCKDTCKVVFMLP